MDFQVLENVMKIYDELKSEKTQEELAQIFEVGSAMQDKIAKIFDTGKNAADDVVNIAKILLAMIDRLSQPEGARALPKPIKECRTLSDVAALL